MLIFSLSKNVQRWRTSAYESSNTQWTAFTAISDIMIKALHNMTDFNTLPHQPQFERLTDVTWCRKKSTYGLRIEISKWNLASAKSVALEFHWLAGTVLIEGVITQCAFECMTTLARRWYLICVIFFLTPNAICLWISDDFAWES